MNNLLKDVGDMVIFATVIQAGSITHGADRLGLERTTVSRRIKNFEDNLGAKLLNRSTKRVTATELGKLCYRHSLQVIQASQDAAAAARGQMAKAPLVVGAPLVIIESLLQPAMNDFVCTFPAAEIEFEVQDGWSTDVGRAVDLLIHLGDAPRSTSEFLVSNIATAKQVIVTSPAYLRKIAEPVDPSEAHRYRWIGYPDTEELISVRIMQETRASEVLIAPKSYVPNMSTARQATTAGLGISVLPEFVCAELIESGLLVPCLPSLDAPDTIISTIEKRSKQPQLLRNAYLDFLSRSCHTPLFRTRQPAKLV